MTPIDSVRIGSFSDRVEQGSGFRFSFTGSIAALEGMLGVSFALLDRRLAASPPDDLCPTLTRALKH